MSAIVVTFIKKVMIVYYHDICSITDLTFKIHIKYLRKLPQKYDIVLTYRYLGGG